MYPSQATVKILNEAKVFKMKPTEHTGTTFSFLN